MASTSTQLLECSLDWTVALNDSVVHNKLLYKLACCGVCDMILVWLKDFLTGRSRAVRVGDCVSTLHFVISGVPQGSVLGPVLFVVFINDIVNCSNDAVSVKLFADDAKLYTVISNESSAANLQSSVDYILSWSNHWQLKLTF